MEHDNLLYEALDAFKVKRTYKVVSKHCNICNKTIKQEQNFPEHCLSNIHIKNAQREMYKSPVIELTKQDGIKKRKFLEDYSTAVNLLKSLKAKDIKTTEMG